MTILAAEDLKVAKEIARAMGWRMEAGGALYDADGCRVEHNGRRLNGYTQLAASLMLRGWLANGQPKGEGKQLLDAAAAAQKAARAIKRKKQRQPGPPEAKPKPNPAPRGEALPSATLKLIERLARGGKTIAQVAEGAGVSRHKTWRALCRMGAPVLYSTPQAARAAIARGEPNAGWSGGEAPRFAPPEDPEPPAPKKGKRRPKKAEKAPAPAPLTKAELSKLEHGTLVNMLTAMLHEPRRPQQRVDRVRKNRKARTAT